MQSNKKKKPVYNRFKKSVSFGMPALMSGAYANTLTGLIPDLYQGLDVVSREMVGFIPSVSRNFSAERAAVGENISYPISPSLASANVVPAMVVPEPTDRTIGVGSMTISKSKLVEFGFTGEEQVGLNNGPGYLTVQADLFAQALRTLVNEIEVDIGTAAAIGASRAYGTAATPFQTNTGETAQLKKILDDNGAPLSGRSMVIDTTAGAALRTLTQLTKVNEAGTSMTLRDGELLNLNSFSIKESAGVQRPASGTNASGTTGTAGYAVGATTIATAAAGTGSILAGDVITFAGDTNKYVVVTGKADVSSGTASIVIAAPGLRVAIPASATTITTVATATRNIAFSQDAIQLVARAPALPQEGDAAIDSMMITDPRSGMTFEIRLYAGYRKIRAEVALAWGWKVVKTNNVAILLG